MPSSKQACTLHFPVPIQSRDQFNELAKTHKYRNQGEYFVYLVNKEYERCHCGEDSIEVSIKVPGQGEGTAIVREGETIEFLPSSKVKVVHRKRDDSEEEVDILE